MPFQGYNLGREPGWFWEGFDSLSPASTSNFWQNSFQIYHFTRKRLGRMIRSFLVAKFVYWESVWYYGNKNGRKIMDTNAIKSRIAQIDTEIEEKRCAIKSLEEEKERLERELRGELEEICKIIVEKGLSLEDVKAMLK